MARKFLYIVAGLIVAFLAVMLALRIWSAELTEIAMVPSVELEAQPALKENAYADPDMWISRPGFGEGDPARWLPQDYNHDAQTMNAAVFFVHPTSFFERTAWNAPEGDVASRDMAELFVQGMASPFNTSADIWAPRYRQATLGAFLTSEPEGAKALDAAYQDVSSAFDHFIATIAKDRPIVLAGHSQGAFHLRRLIHEKIAGTPTASRIAAAYIIGWPVSLDHDLPAMGLPACSAPEQSGCILSWLSVAEPAETEILLRAYDRQTGLDVKKLGGSAFLCTNPLTGSAGGEAPAPTPASANLGTLVPDLASKSGTLVIGKVPAQCREDGFLSIGLPPTFELGPYVLPGNNYHMFDMVLFWANLRKDAVARTNAWAKEQ